MIPTRLQAEEYLAEAAQLNPGPWVAHSRYVARGAELIAAQHPELDSDRAFILGLLHDIGRRAGIHGMRHIVDGYYYLITEVYPGAARICLTHSYPVKEDVEGASPWDGSEQELELVRNYLDNIAYNSYDRLIQLCDALCLPSGFCLIEKRLVDVVMRYGFSKNTVSRWRGFFSIKQEFEEVVGTSIYKYLPGVIENTFESHGEV